MRRVPFHSVLTAASLLWDGKESPDARTAAQLGVALNRRAAEFWEAFPWPEWSPTGRRLFAPLYDPAESLASPAVRYHPPADAYYQSLLPAASGPDAPVDDAGTLNAAQWALLPWCDTPGDWDGTRSYAAADKVRHPVSLRLFQARLATPAGALNPYDARLATHTLGSSDLFTGQVTQGLTLATGDRVLRFNSGASEEGIWVVGPVGGTRATDADTADEVLARPYVRVAAGTYAGQWFRVDTAFYDLFINQVYFGPLPAVDQGGVTSYPQPALEPGVSPGWQNFWGEVFPFYRVIALDQAGETPIGECLHVYDRDPRATCGRALELHQEIIAEGVLVKAGPNVVWIRFRLRPPNWAGEIWAADKTFALDAGAWDAATGDYYQSLVANNTGHAVTDATKWLRLDFPYVLRHAVAQGAYADMLRMDGQQEKYQLELAEALRLLRREFDKLERQQGQTRPLPVRSRC